ncbi:MAG: hypothetical protein DCC68_14865 [Planctomycetota bacterium]|nr:MAG: hypothetical protein DCC68_14865 [Planctomycetota bacterium]
MTAITRQDLEQVSAADGGWRVSIYLPTHVAGEQNQQASVRYKNLLRDARQRLLARGMAEEDADRLLAAASRVAEDASFWRTPAKGAAILIDATGVRTWPLPTQCPEVATAGTTFYIVPLIATFNVQAAYFLLAVSQKRARLMRCANDELVEVAVAGLPETGIESLGYDEPEERSQTHTASPGLPGKQSLVFHGQGGAADAAKKELVEYLRRVDRAVAAAMENDDLPLIFAGVDYLFPIYKEVNTASRLFASHLSGSPDYASSQTLAERARVLLAEAREGRTDADIDRYWKNASGGKTEKRAEQIVRDSQAGVVDMLFIDPSLPLWGRFDPLTGDVRVDGERRLDSDSLINTAAVNVVRRGGSVATTATGYVPGGGAMAAILRFSAEVPAGA